MVAVENLAVLTLLFRYKSAQKTIESVSSLLLDSSAALNEI